MVFLPILLSIDIRCSTGWASPFFWMIFVSFISFKFSLFSFGCALRFAITCSQLVLKTLAYFLGTGSSDDSIAHTKITEKKIHQRQLNTHFQFLCACCAPVYIWVSDAKLHLYGLWWSVHRRWFLVYIFLLLLLLFCFVCCKKKKRNMYILYIYRGTHSTQRTCTRNENE